MQIRDFELPPQRSAVCKQRPAGDESVALQALDGARNRDVGDAETPRQVDNTRFAGLGDQLGNDLDVILRDLV